MAKSEYEWGKISIQVTTVHTSVSLSIEKYIHEIQQQEKVKYKCITWWLTLGYPYFGSA